MESIILTILRNFLKFSFISLILISSNSLMSSNFGYVNIKDTAGRNWFFRANNINCKVYLWSDNNLLCDASAVVTDVLGKKNTKTYFDHPCHNTITGFSNDVLCTAAKRLNKTFQDFENQVEINQREIREEQEREKIEEEKAKEKAEEKKIKEEVEFQLRVDEIKKKFR